jgi:hypothetical protein
MLLQSRDLVNTCTRGESVGVVPSSALRDGKPADIVDMKPRIL